VTYVALALCCALLCYGAINALASLGVALYWRLTSRRRASSLPAPSSVFLVRMFPAAVSSLFVTLFFLPGFLQFEPADTTETVSGLMLASVSAPLLVLVWGGLRGVLSWLKTDRLVQRWMSRAERRYLAGTSTDVYCIDSDFPVVSLAGVIRPRLFVSSRVMASCTQEELAGILAHEAAHHRSGDNLKRLLMRFCPDFLAWTSTSRRRERMLMRGQISHPRLSRSRAKLSAAASRRRFSPARFTGAKASIDAFVVWWLSPPVLQKSVTVGHG
jgi:Zn-dependent protease with chaperone function